ncbi:MAG: serine/threonine-protein phosphatase [Lachnospiraceae bacterium]|nr:serine/threonine-protein phosphatase [Lachnospiraceae bacterium]
MNVYGEGFCDAGIRRSINQDVIAMYQGGDTGLYLVSDGMGGHSEGERASRELLTACRQWWRKRQERTAELDFQENISQLQEVLTRASRKIWEETPKGEICGATVVLLWIQEQNYGLLWAGDSRCYLAEPGVFRTSVRQLSEDDVWENQPGLRGRLSRKELAVHPNRGKLVRAAGVSEQFECRVRTGYLRKNFVFALCSDGVYKYLEPGKLSALLRKTLRSGDCGRALEEMAGQVYENHAPDNLSCILVKPLR